MSNSTIFTVGGTVQASGGFYIQRAADDELLSLCRSGSFAFVLTSRQVGKSSLMINTSKRLAEEDIKSVIVDLTEIGRDVDAEQWYLGVLTIIATELKIKADIFEWWKSHNQLSAIQRLTSFFADILLTEILTPVVIFIDEIDTTLSFRFRDDFFAAIRYFYNARAHIPEFRRLTFVLLGVATPSDLISDPQRTPFNIGQRVELMDFTEAEMIPFAQALRLPPNETRQVIQWIRAWSGGHPYLTQRLCYEIARQERRSWSKTDIDTVVANLFFCPASQEDSNLRFTQDMLIKRASDPRGVLTTFEQILRGRPPVHDDEHSYIKSHLKLAGIVQRDAEGVLVLRNRIYAEIFNLEWVAEQLALLGLQAPELPDVACPYVGLNPFQAEQHHLFFGRQRLIDELVERLKTKRLLVIVGPSGSGKSSLVLSGLLPALKSGVLPGSEDWHYCSPLLPGSNPLANLARSSVPADADTAEWTQHQIECFQQDKNHLANMLGQEAGKPTVFIVNQFEEIFTLCDDYQMRQVFIDNLLGLLQAPIAGYIVIITMRTGFESHMAQFPQFLSLFEQARFRITPPSVGELRSAIEEPAKLAGLVFEDGVVDALIQDVLGEPVSLPLLQFTLLRLWETRKRNQVTWEAYQRLGGGRNALAHSAEEFYEKLVLEEQITTKRILVRLVRLEEGREFSTLRVQRKALYRIREARDRVDRVLEKLIQSYLVRLLEGDSPYDDQVEIAHEALLRNWPRLVDWLDEERANLSGRLRLRTGAEEWARLGRDLSALWRGVQLEEALRFEDLDDLEKEFVQASIQYRDREAAVKEAQRQREMETLRKLASEAEARRQVEAQRAADANAHAREQEAATKRQRRLTMNARIYALAAAALLVCAIFLLFTVIRNESALQKANSDVSNKNLQLNQKTTELQLSGAERLVERALSELNSKPADALQRAVQAITETAQITNVGLPSADIALRQGLNMVAGTPLATYTETAKLAASPDGHWLATYGKGVGLQLWSMTDGTPSLTFSLPPDPARALAYAIFSADSHWLAVIDNADRVRLWNVSGKSVKADQFLIAQGHQNGFANMAFDPTGQWLVTIDAKGDEQLYALTQTTGFLTPIKQLSDSEDGLMLVAFSPPAARERVLFVVNGNQIDRWDIRDLAGLKQLDSLPIPEDLIGDLRLDPMQGRWLATIDFAGYIWLRDLTEPSVGPSLIFTPTVPLPETESMPLQPQFAFDWQGQLLVTPRGEQTLQLWKLGEQMPHSPWRELKHSDAIRSFALSRDGRWLTIVDNANQVCQWSTMDATVRPFCLADDSLAKNTLATFSADGRWLIAWRQDNVPRLLDLSHLADHSQPLSLPRFVPVYGHDDTITDLLITDNGKWLVTSSADGHVRLLDLTSNWQAQNPTPLPLSKPVQALTFAVTDSLIAANATSGHIFTWPLAVPLDIVTNSLPSLVSQEAQRSEKVALHQSGELVAVGNPEQDITLWKISGNHPLSTTLISGQSPVQKLTFSGNGTKLAAATQNGVLYVWSINGLQPSIPVTIANRYTPITALALSNDGRWLALGAEKAPLQIWALDQPLPQVAATLEMSAKQIARTIAFSADNRWLASGGDIFQVRSIPIKANAVAAPSGFIRLWRLDATPQRMTLGQPIDLRGHDQSVTALAFSPQGDLLASGSLDTSVRLWDLRTVADGQKARLVLTDHAAPVQNLAFSRDGQWLATLDGDAHLFLWNMQADELALDVSKLVAAACRKVDCTLGESPEVAPFAVEPTYCGTCNR